MRLSGRWPKIVTTRQLFNYLPAESVPHSLISLFTFCTVEVPQIFPRVHQNLVEQRPKFGMAPSFSTFITDEMSVLCLLIC